MINNILLGIRYFLTHCVLVHILLRVVQLVNMIVSKVLDISYFFTTCCIFPIHSHKISWIRLYLGRLRK